MVLRLQCHTLARGHGFIPDMVGTLQGKPAGAKLFS